MRDFRKKLTCKPYGLFYLFALLLCACTPMPEHCGDYVSVSSTQGCGGSNGNGGTTPTTYTVTYNINSGTGTRPPAQTVDAGSSVTLADGSGLTRNGFTFGGWNTNSSGSGTNYDAGSSFTPATNITLYAKWNTSSGGGSCSYTGPTVKIGNLTWMAENLNCETANSWCYESNCTKYGTSYTRNAAMSACPAGWRLPTDGDWNNLITAAGGNVAGKALKSKAPDWDGNDDFDFSALPGGFHANGSFYNTGIEGQWWSATEVRHSEYGEYVQYWSMSTSTDYVEEGGVPKGNGVGFSVRCVMN